MLDCGKIFRSVRLGGDVKHKPQVNAGFVPLDLEKLKASELSENGQSPHVSGMNMESVRVYKLQRINYMKS